VLGRFAVVPALADLARVDEAVAAEQFQQEVAVILAEGLRDLGGGFDRAADARLRAAAAGCRSSRHRFPHRSASKSSSRATALMIWPAWQ